MKTSKQEKLWERLHQEALHKGESSYLDPETGALVFTSSFHLERGVCCGSCCRHCPYNHENVPSQAE